MQSIRSELQQPPSPRRLFALSLYIQRTERLSLLSKAQSDVSLLRGTMHFGAMVQGNIYSVGLRRELAGAKVYTVKH
jgi:hypothetical protein